MGMDRMSRFTAMILFYASIVVIGAITLGVVR